MKMMGAVVAVNIPLVVVVAVTMAAIAQLMMMGLTHQ